MSYLYLSPPPSLNCCCKSRTLSLTFVYQDYPPSHVSSHYSPLRTTITRRNTAATYSTSPPKMNPPAAPSSFGPTLDVNAWSPCHSSIWAPQPITSPKTWSKAIKAFSHADIPVAPRPNLQTGHPLPLISSSSLPQRNHEAAPGQLPFRNNSNPTDDLLGNHWSSSSPTVHDLHVQQLLRTLKMSSPDLFRFIPSPSPRN